MATVTLRLAPRPAHVRTARLVASAMARRSGVNEELLDDVRLAVGEACARAVRLHQRHGVDAPVILELTDGEDFTIVVTDSVADGVAGATPDRIDLVASLTGASGVVGEVSEAGTRTVGRTDDGSPAAWVATEVTEITEMGLAETPGWVESERLGLAVLAGVVDDLRVERRANGTRVHMRWPIKD